MSYLELFYSLEGNLTHTIWLHNYQHRIIGVHLEKFVYPIETVKMCSEIFLVANIKSIFRINYFLYNRLRHWKMEQFCREIFMYLSPTDGYHKSVCKINADFVKHSFDMILKSKTTFLSLLIMKEFLIILLRIYKN